MSRHRAHGSLCVVLLDYIAPLAAIDALMATHVDWLDKGFDAGVFLVAGRQEPRIGGVILARGDRTAIEEIARTDPFVTAGAATARVIQFNASFADPAIAALIA